MNDLPIMKYVNEIITTVQKYQVTILMGETGCGKTTMLSQILFDHSVPCKNPTIITTNPRRIGAESVAERVSTLRRCELGKEVGCRFRWEYCYILCPQGLEKCLWGIHQSEI